MRRAEVVECNIQAIGEDAVVCHFLEIPICGEPPNERDLLMNGRAPALTLICVSVLASGGLARAMQEPANEYVVSVIEPQHHWLQVELKLLDVPPGPVELRMSRSSPGRYALHEFAKNVFDVQAFDGAGKTLSILRPNPHQWNVGDHDGTVRVRYRLYGDRADGTYMQVDTSHAHMNAPATFMWPRGELGRRPIRVHLDAPDGEDWVVATQLFPTNEPNTFTAPNLRYLLDSPIEFGETRLWEFDIEDGQTIRVALHHTGGDDEAIEYLAGVEAIVRETRHVYGEYPRFDGGTYTFIADYLPWADGDGMEHRNSTILSSRASLAQARVVLLGTVSHEFFHAWNVERIRPASLEPFNFDGANMSSELWLAEGFTSYYGNLVMARAGVIDTERLLGSLGAFVNAVRQSPGVRLRSATEMSRLAPFVDAARPVDRTYWNNTFLSYYTFGAALGLGLDLTLRDRSDGAITLDTFMRAMWKRFGEGGGTPPSVARPYTVADAQQVLGEVSGDNAFADSFFERHIMGNDVIDYAPLLDRAGLLVRLSRPSQAYLGASFDDGGGELRISAPTNVGSPAHRGGLDQDDVVLEIAGTRVHSGDALRRVLADHSPGDVVDVRFRRRDGTDETAELTLSENPEIRVVPIEQAGGSLTDAQRRFRNEWLASRIH